MNLIVSVEYFGKIRNELPAEGEVVRIDAGATVDDVFDQLTDRHGPDLRDVLLGPRGEPLPNVVVTLDGRRIADRRGMEQLIVANGVLRILQMPPFIGGG